MARPYHPGRDPSIQLSLDSMQSRIIIFLVAAAILFTVLVPAVVFIAAVLLLITPTLLVARRPIDEVFAAQPISLRNLPLFRAPPAFRV
jgi:hypothetical protein